MSDELNKLQTDIALIKSDIRQINKFFSKVEKSLDMMTELSQNVAVHSESIKWQQEKLDDVQELCETFQKNDNLRMNVMSERLEEYRRMAREDHQILSDKNAASRAERNQEIMDALSKLNGALDKRINEVERTSKSLENWKYYMMGVGAVVIFIAMRIQWPALFG